MIAVDTSALAAIALNEPEAAMFSRLMSENRCLIGAPTLLEASMVLNRRSREAAAYIEVLTTIEHIVFVAFDAYHARFALAAFDRFGKGSGHPAQLNYGDCMSYAVARVADVPLLYKGADFAHTDIVSAAA